MSQQTVNLLKAATRWLETKSDEDLVKVRDSINLIEKSELLLIREMENVSMELTIDQRERLVRAIKRFLFADQSEG